MHYHYPIHGSILDIIYCLNTPPLYKSFCVISSFASHLFSNDCGFGINSSSLGYGSLYGKVPPAVYRCHLVALFRVIDLISCLFFHPL